MTRILITGASGAVGQTLTPLLADSGHEVIATDLRRPASLPEGVTFRKLDVTGHDPSNVISEISPHVVVHLASIVTPPKGSTRKFEYTVDVTGSQNVLDACIDNKVSRIVVTSSGAAYGYHPENASPLFETDPVRGNQEFPYSYHKRLVEEMLEEARETAPQLEQVVLRVGTVLGAGLENQITALFHAKRLLAVGESKGPFVFIWTKDLANIVLRAATSGPAGIFNVAGDGAMTVDDLAQELDKPVLRLPIWLMKAILGIGKPLGLTRYGPEQVRFLQYRPVLDNTALKTEFGYTPELTSREVFQLWKKAAAL